MLVKVEYTDVVIVDDRASSLACAPCKVMILRARKGKFLVKAAKCPECVSPDADILSR